MGRIFALRHASLGRTEAETSAGFQAGLAANLIRRMACGRTLRAPRPQSPRVVGHRTLEEVIAFELIDWLTGNLEIARRHKVLAVA